MQDSCDIVQRRSYSNSEIDVRKVERNSIAQANNLTRRSRWNRSYNIQSEEVPTYTSNCYETCYQTNSLHSIYSTGSNVSTSDYEEDADDDYYCEDVYSIGNSSFNNLEFKNDNSDNDQSQYVDYKNDDEDMLQLLESLPLPETKLLRSRASCWMYYPYSTMILPKECYHVIPQEEAEEKEEVEKTTTLVTDNTNQTNECSTTTIKPNWIEVTKFPPTSGPSIILE